MITITSHMVTSHHTWSPSHMVTITHVHHHTWSPSHMVTSHHHHTWSHTSHVTLIPQELLANLNGRDQALHTFYAIGQILVNEMTSSNATEPSIRAELTAIRSRQESLCTHLERFKERCEQAQYNYDHFLTGLGETNLKLCALEAMLRDDLCETYSRRVADEVLCAQKTKLKVCLQVSGEIVMYKTTWGFFFGGGGGGSHVFTKLNTLLF